MSGGTVQCSTRIPMQGIRITKRKILGDSIRHEKERGRRRHREMCTSASRFENISQSNVVWSMHYAILSGELRSQVLV